MTGVPDREAAALSQRWLTYKLRRWATAREKRNPFGHGKTGTALLRQAADRIEELERDNEHAYNAYRELTEGRP